MAAGPIGIVLAGATIALGSVRCGEFRASGDAVQVRTKQADGLELKGTLDQFTGAVTERDPGKQVAGDSVSPRTLADGHTAPWPTG
jgi:hypothetical protein